MKKVTWCAALALAALAVPAWAQDSTVYDVTYINYGDAVFAYEDATGGPYNSGSEQLNTYVVDTVPLTSSWGGTFRIAPLVKASKSGTAYLNAQLSAQTISNTHLTGVPYPFQSYSLWTQPGYGINNLAVLNQPGAPVAPAGTSNQFAVAFAEFGDSLGGIVGGLVNYDPTNPHRLYVARVVAAINGNNMGENSAAYGFGSVDAHGNVHFRADGFNCPGPSALTKNNLFRVRIPARNAAARNVTSLLGPSDAAATDWVLNEDPNTFAPPSIIPQSVAGRPVLLTTNYVKEYAYEQSAYPAPLVRTLAHRPGYVTDHRGCMYFSSKLACGNAVGTAAVVGYDAASKPRVLNTWSVDANGNIVSTMGLDPTLKLGLPGGGFRFYDGNHGFRGGNGLVSVGQDQQGRGLAAGLWSFANDPNDPNDAILVARFACGSTDPTLADWKIAADNRPASATPILNGPGGTAIGRLALRKSGGIYQGPSMSPPAMDSVGNLYFIAVCEIFGNQQDPNSTYPYSLVRAVYNPSTFNYELELLLKSGDPNAPYGDIFHGANSDRNFKVTYLSLMYVSGTAGRLNPSTFYSGNVMQTAYAGLDPAGLQTSDPRTLGGLVLNASITYDSNNDGVYDPTALGPDEKYAVLLYISGDGALTPPTGACCLPDGSCTVTSQAACNGVFQGVGTVCTPTTCPQPTGACCIHGACSLLTQAACTTAGGTFKGAGTTCTPDACPCRGDGNCDHVINWRDIDYLIAGQNDNSSAWAALFPSGPTCPFLNLDTSSDSHVNWRDIDPFIALMNTSCP
jgi:hypothetical protein